MIFTRPARFATNRGARVAALASTGATYASPQSLPPRWDKRSLGSANELSKLNAPNSIGILGMEYTLTPATPRSLVRRLAPWTAALGLFAGGGYGVYRYAAPGPSDQAEKQAGGEEAAPAETSLAKDHYKQLFGAPSSSEPTSSNDRYASPAPPALPPLQREDVVTTPRDAAAVTNVANPFAAAPVANKPNRYATPAPTQVDPAPTPANPFAPSSQTATTSPNGLAASAASKAPEQTAPPAAPKSESIANAETQAAAEPAEITRGQEPSANPLRAAASRTTPAAGSPEAARAAFADAAPPATPQTLDLSAKSPAPSTPSTPEPTLGAPASTPSIADRYAAAPIPQSQPAAEPAVPKVAAASPASPEPAIASKQLPRDEVPAQFRPAMPELGPTAETAATAEPTVPRQARVASAAPRSAQQQLDALADSAAITPTPGLAAVDGAGVPGDRALEGVQSSAVTIQKLVPQEIQVNKKCTFAIRVQNTSQHAMHNVQIRDEVPLGTKLIGAAPKADVAGSQVTWDLGTLPPGEERIVEMELLPSEEGELGSVATVTYAVQASAKVRSTRPELALRLSAEPRVMLGQQHVVRIEVSNPGSGDATGVMLLESIPEGVSHEAGPALEYPIGTLKAGDSRTIDLVLTAEQAGKINNVMTARGDANLQVQANCEFEVIAPDLKISVQGPKQRYLERPATYQIGVTNPGTASANEVQLIAKLPDGLQFVSANNMGEYDATTRSVYWSLAELPANEPGGSVELTALPVEVGEHTLQVATRAQQGLEDRAEARMIVEGLVALSFEARAVDGAIEVGGETTYEVTVVNQGSKAASNVQVVAIMPEGIRAASSQGESRHEVQGERIVFAPLPQLAPKAEAKFRVNVQGLRPGDQRTRVQVTTDEVREPITKELSTQVYSDQ